MRRSRRPARTWPACSAAFQPVLPDGRSWDDAREAAADTVIDTVNEYAPNFKASILAREIFHAPGHGARVRTDARRHLPRRVGTRPIVPGAAMLGHGDYRGPVKGWYHCGAGAHPGGGVTGLPGRSCARRNDSRLPAPARLNPPARTGPEGAKKSPGGTPPGLSQNALRYAFSSSASNGSARSACRQHGNGIGDAAPTGRQTDFADAAGRVVGRQHPGRDLRRLVMRRMGVVMEIRLLDLPPLNVIRSYSAWLMPKTMLLSICASMFFGCSATPGSTAHQTSCTWILPVLRSTETSATWAQCAFPGVE